MRPNLRIGAVAVVLWYVLGAPTAFAQDTNGSPQGDSWATIAKLPDWWDGAWEPLLGRVPGRPASGKPVLTPAWQKKVDKVDAIMEAGGDVPSRVYHCIPGGFPGGMAAPTRLYEWLFTPGLVSMLVQNNENRRIYTDGRGHPTDYKPGYFGHSIGHWEGDTLVVDTVALDPGNEFLYGVPGGKGMHVVERIRLADPNTLVADSVLVAPQALKQPYHYTYRFRRKYFRVREEICTQNNRDVNANTLGQQFDLTPPPLKR